MPVFFNECRLCGAMYREFNWNGSLCNSCHAMWREQYTFVMLACNRTRKLGLPSTLTVRQWVMTLYYFKRTCAYCQEAPYQDLEHFIPVGLGGGTTKGNCIPACHLCNARKGKHHPNDVTLIPETDIKRICNFLAGYA